MVVGLSASSTPQEQLRSGNINASTPHAVFSINGNSDLDSQLNATGDGSPGNPYKIWNYEITATSSSAILIQNTDKFISIKNCTITVTDPDSFGHHGIILDNCTNVLVDNCTVTSGFWGIGIISCHYSNITGSHISGIHSITVYVSSSDNIIISDCNVSSNGSVNRFSLAYVQDCFVFNNTVQGGGYGVLIQYSNTAYIKDNIFIENQYGEYAFNSHHLLFDNNTINASTNHASSFNNVSYSNFTREHILDCGMRGIDISNSIGCFIQDNEIYFTGSTGINLRNVNGTEISNNEISDTGNSGIGLSTGSTGNNITKNIFTGNPFAGVWIGLSSGNTIYENTFVGVRGSDNSVNDWDYGGVGNYWSGYSGYDLDDDGIGDLVFHVDDGSNVDHYPIFIDTDNDELTDLREILVWGSNPSNNDSDGDSMPDGWEDYNGLDVMADDSLLDLDGDFLQNIYEFSLGTNPNNNDTDGDLMGDGWEIWNSLDPLNASDANDDPDFDLLLNYEEYAAHTSPFDNDTDSDLMDDYWEVTNGLNATNSSDASDDPDLDGLDNLFEYNAGTNPNNNDTDGDLIDDAWELNFSLDPLNASDANDDPDLDLLTNLEEYAAHTSPFDNDTDSDLMDDYWEVMNGLNATNSSDASDDPDLDDLDNLGECIHGLDPHVNDTDADGITDGYEVIHGLNLTADDSLEDPDDDDLTNLFEFQIGTSASNPDTDGDGIKDGIELNVFFLDPIDPDSDDDLMGDGWEIIHGLEPNVNDSSNDADGDGLTNLQELNLGTNPSIIDSDADGYSDGQEILLNTDPLDPSSKPRDPLSIEA
ncbi:MAG: right-handed parallel beta-helix repeat-containing protein [Promethearchaeota archaeon]